MGAHTRLQARPGRRQGKSRRRTGGYSKAEGSGAKEHQEGSQGSPAEEDHHTIAEEDADGAGQRGR
jgi:hypothetical protein